MTNPKTNPTTNPLADYLRDHLVGASLAVDLLETMRDEYAGKELGRFASNLLVEVQADRVALQGLVERAGSSTLKEMGGWIAEKVSRFKLTRSASGGLGFEALEFLALGILGKLSLWRALAVVAPADNRLYGLDFYRLADRAREQHEQVEVRRLEVARTALPSPEASPQADLSTSTSPGTK